MLVEKCGWAIEESLFSETKQNSTFSHTCENSKMSSMILKYFSFLNNKPPERCFEIINSLGNNISSPRRNNLCLSWFTLITYVYSDVVVALRVAVSAISDKFPPYRVRKSWWWDFLMIFLSGNTTYGCS